MTSASIDAVATWPLRDYVSPGLTIVRPDHSFPHMRASDPLLHPWKFLRRDVPHVWYADERFPLMGFLNRDEAVLLHNIALSFSGKRALEIGSWLAWSTCHLALAGVDVDVIDPAHDDPLIRASIEDSLSRCGVSQRVNLTGGRSPDSIAALDRKWSLFFIDGDHEPPAPVRDTLASLPFANHDCAFVFHDLASPDVAAALRLLATRGFHVLVYQTAQIMGLAWRGNVTPVAHVPDPDVAWQMPMHLAGLPVCGIDEVRIAPPSYRQLHEVDYRGDTMRPSVCIVTSELIGPFKNGGVGTAMTGLAETLAGDGLSVTVLYTGAISSPDVALDSWREHYAARGIELGVVMIDDLRAITGPLRDRGFGVPWLVYRYLREHRFDVIHFNDCCGDGSVALTAKKLGVAFADSLLVVALHSPSRWVLELNQVLPTSIILAAFDYAEQLSVKCADVLWSPSRYLLDWIAARDFELPAQTFIQQYAIPQSARKKTTTGPTPPPKEIVFFGRLEERKGLRLFCNAVDLLRDDLAQRNIAVTFLGKPENCAGMPSLDYIARRAKAWQFPVRTITDFGQPEALAYLARGDKLAVMPSPFDNSPCTVYEALACSIPFLATRTGGIPELIDEADRDKVLFDDSTDSLRHVLQDAIEHGGWIANPAMSQDETRRSWTSMHAHWRAFMQPVEAATTRPFTVAAIIDHAAGAPLESTLQSLTTCSRVIVLNRSGESLSIANIDLLAADRDAIESQFAAITEDIVLLIHSGVSVIAEPFVKMLESLDVASVDGLQPAARVGSRIAPALGGSAVFSLFEGSTFTGALVIRRDAMVAARDGRAFAFDSPFLGIADFCVSRNARIWPYPEAVIDRPEGFAINAKSSVPARVAAYGDASPANRYYMLAAGYGAASREHSVGYRRIFALAAIDLGLSMLIRAGVRVMRVLRRWVR